MVQAHGAIRHPHKASAGVMLYFSMLDTGCSLYYSLLCMSEIFHNGKKGGREGGRLVWMDLLFKMLL